jgi:hypothetical protein
VTQDDVKEGSTELNMIMLIDTLGERYGILPSEVMLRANTFDVFIADTAISYRNLVQDRQMNGDKMPEVSEAELLELRRTVNG